MRIRILLIVLIILSLLGGISSTIVLMTKGIIGYDFLLTMAVVYAINLACARYLYKKSHDHKFEWALFGFLGNVTAIIVYHARHYIMNRWEKGKSIFRD